MTTDDRTRLHVYMTDELADDIRRAAAEAGAEQGHTVSMSEWLRDAARRKLTTNEEES